MVQVSPLARERARSMPGRDTVAGVSRLERITSDPAVCHGQPTIRGLRYTVESLLELLGAVAAVADVTECVLNPSSTTSEATVLTIASRTRRMVCSFRSEKSCEM